MEDYQDAGMPHAQQRQEQQQQQQGQQGYGVEDMEGDDAGMQQGLQQQPSEEPDMLLDEHMLGYGGGDDGEGEFEQAGEAGQPAQGGEMDDGGGGAQHGAIVLGRPPTRGDRGRLTLRLYEQAAGVEDAAEEAAADAAADQGEDAGEDSEADSVLQFSEDEDEELDTTAAQAAEGRDLQGIPWEQLQFSREHYRATRINQYRNYVNVLPEDADKYRPDLLKTCKHPTYGHTFYGFQRNFRSVNTTIVHFQLRNLVWATSRNDVYVVSQNSINHWNPATRRIIEVINLSGVGRKRTVPPGMGKVQVSTLCARDDLVAAGGFGGELVVKRVGDLGWVYAGKISNSENGITNGLELTHSAAHGPCVMAANNDSMVRVYTAQHGFKSIAHWEFPWAVNYASMQPLAGVSDSRDLPLSSSLVAVVGDDPVTHLTDMRTGRPVTQLSAHQDYSFAAAWHPQGYLLATGNQDTSTVVWDIRRADTPLARLAGRMGAIRALRWSPDGRHLAASEPADFVHIYSVDAGFELAQEIDLFGEISGVSFTPAGDQLLVGIADITYASLLTFTRARHGQQYVPQPKYLWA